MSEIREGVSSELFDEQHGLVREQYKEMLTPWRSHPAPQVFTPEVPNTRWIRLFCIRPPRRPMTFSRLSIETPGSDPKFETAQVFVCEDYSASYIREKTMVELGLDVERIPVSILTPKERILHRASVPAKRCHRRSHHGILQGLGAVGAGMMGIWEPAGEMTEREKLIFHMFGYNLNAGAPEKSKSSPNNY